MLCSLLTLDCDNGAKLSKSIFKCIAAKSLEYLLQQLPALTSSISMLSNLMDVALVESSLTSFVGLHFLEKRCAYLQQRCMESNMNPQMYFQVAKKLGVISKVNEKEESRKAMASELNGMSNKPLDLCIKALELNGDNLNFAYNWLLDKSDAFVANGGLKNNTGERNPRMEAAISLCQTSQFPTWLCEKALELCEEDVNKAFHWLEEQPGEGQGSNGQRYEKLYKENERSDKADESESSRKAAFDDSAAIDDMAENDAPIADSSDVGAESTADEKNAKIECQRREGAPCVTLKRCDKTTSSGMIVNHGSKRSTLRTTEGRPGIVVDRRKNQAMVRFMDVETGQCHCEEIPLSQLKHHEKMYDTPICSPEDVCELFEKSLKLLCIRYCRGSIIHLLSNVGSSLALKDAVVSEEATKSLSKLRQDFRERNIADLEVVHDESSHDDGATVGVESSHAATASVSPPVELDETQIVMLVSMGFPDNAVRQALIASNNNMQRAVELLMDPSFISASAEVQQSIPGDEGEGSGTEDDEAAMLAAAIAMSTNVECGSSEPSTHEQTEGGNEAADRSGSMEEDIGGLASSTDAVAESFEAVNQEKTGGGSAVDFAERSLLEVKDLVEAIDVESSPQAASACALIHIVKLIASTERALTKAKLDADSLVGKLRKLMAFVLKQEVNEDDKPLSAVLVEECITHLIQSTQQGRKKTKKFESLHPYYRRSSYGGSASFPGARALRITFDPRCGTSGEQAAHLLFFSDENCTHQIARFSGNTGWRPFIVEAGTVYFRFQSRENDNSWGYSFEVAPITGLQWVNEKELFTAASLEWACYVLDFLLNEGLELGIGAAVHKPQIFDALVRYLCFPGAPYKGRVVSLLLQLLQSPDLFPADGRPNLQLLEGVGQIVTERCTADLADPACMPSSALQALVELEATRRKVKKYYDELDMEGVEAAKELPVAECVRNLIENSGQRDAILPVVSHAHDLVPEIQADLTLSEAPSCMLELLEMMRCFKTGGRFSNAVLTEAYLHNMNSQVEESNHPHPCGSTSGTVEFRYAQSIELVHDGRSMLGRGATFELQCRSHEDNDKGERTWTKVSQELKPGTLLLLDTDMVKWKITYTGKPSDALWGWRMMFRATALKPAYIKHQLPDTDDVNRDLVGLMAGWDVDGKADEELTQWVNRAASSFQLPPDICGSMLVCTTSIKLSKNEHLRLQELSGRSAHNLGLRYSLIRAFNRRLKHLLNLVDLSKADFHWSIAAAVQNASHLIFADVKQKYIRAALRATSHRVIRPPARRHRTDVTIDRVGEAQQSNLSGAVDPLRNRGVFVQLYNELRDWHPAHLRREGQAFRVKFVREEGIDAGGPYRECLNEAVEDLFSPRLSLFLKTPNAENEGGVGYIPNSKCATPTHTKMYEFVGKLMGISLRSDGCFGFDFPPLIWKLLVGATPNRDDLALIDQAGMQILDRLSTGEFSVDGQDLYFVTKASSGDEVELFRHGKSTPVDVSNKDQYCKLVEEFKLREFDSTVQAMRRGFITIVPERVLGLTLWHELEDLVVGSSEIDIAVLKAHTQYNSRRFEASATVKHFWTVLESFTNDERAMFVRFTWGRSRLPRSGRWENQFTIVKCGTDTDRLPVAHTCFFQLDLPPYETEDDLRMKLLLAINDGAGSMMIV